MRIQILVGMIASGKSTYCRNAARLGIICLSDDAVVNMVHGNEYTLYSENLKVLYKGIENHVVGAALALQRTVLVDIGRNISVQARRRWIALAKSVDVPCEAIVLPRSTPEVCARRRADSDPRGHSYAYWLKVAESHDALYAAPTLHEGFDCISDVSREDIENRRVSFGGFTQEVAA